MSSQAAIPAERWEAHKSKIHDLYIDQNLTLDQVVCAMTTHGLQASKQQYSRQFKKWGVSKNRKAADWKYISKNLTYRGRQGKKSVVFVNSQEIPLEKVLRETRRYDLPSLIPQSPTPEVMDYIRVCTPPLLVTNALNIGTSQSTSQLGRSSRNEAVQNIKCVMPIMVDNLPSLQFMDLLDLNMQSNQDSLIRQSLTLSPDFLGDLKTIFKLCDTLLQFHGFSSQNLYLASGPSTAQYNPYKRLHELSSSIQCLSSKQTLPASISLLKILVSLSANGHLNTTKEDTFRDLVDILQEIHPLRQFLLLVSKHNLYWILERVVNMHTAATDIFTGHVLLHAVDLGLHKFVQFLVQSKCPLDATRPYNEFAKEDDILQRQHRGGEHVTAFRLAAVFRRDVDMVQILLGAGANVVEVPYGSKPVLERVLIDWLQWDATSPTDSDMILFQCLLDANIAADQSRDNHKWASLVACALKFNAMNFCKIILGSLLHLIRRETHDVCSALFTAAMTNEIFPLEIVLSDRGFWIDDLRQDGLSRLIFRGAFGITILKPSAKALRLLIEHGPTLSADFGSDISWVLTHGFQAGPDRTWLRTPETLADHDVFLYLCQNCHTYLNDEAKANMVLVALRYKWFDAIRVLRNHGVSMHQMYYPECLLQFYAATHMLDNTDLLERILEESLPMSRHETLCFLVVLTKTGEPALLERFVEGYESKNPQASSLLEMPEFLLAIFENDVQGSEVLLWLIQSGTRFDALNEKLSLGYDELLRAKQSRQARKHQTRWLRFCHPPSVLQSAFVNGLLPCRALLVMCTLHCSEHCTENLRLVLEAAMDFGNPFSREDLSNCLEVILRAYTGKYGAWRCWCWRSYVNGGFGARQNSHLEGIRRLLKNGAFTETAWLQDFLENHAGLYDEFVWKSLEWNMDPILTAIELDNVPLLERFLKEGFLHNEYVHWHIPLAPLPWASRKGNWEMIDLLLRNGADVNAPAYPEWGETALQSAVGRGDLSIVLKMLRFGADINAPAARYYGGRTALENAAIGGRLDIVQLLIANNPDSLKLREDCKRASRLASDRKHSVLAMMLEDHARKLAERLGVDHADEIDSFCMCKIERHPSHFPQCEMYVRPAPKEAPLPPCCRKQTHDCQTASEEASRSIFQ